MRISLYMRYKEIVQEEIKKIETLECINEVIEMLMNSKYTYYEITEYIKNNQGIDISKSSLGRYYLIKLYRNQPIGI